MFQPLTEQSVLLAAKLRVAAPAKVKDFSITNCKRQKNKIYDHKVCFEKSNRICKGKTTEESLKPQSTQPFKLSCHNFILISRAKALLEVSSCFLLSNASYCAQEIYYLSILGLCNTLRKRVIVSAAVFVLRCKN